jgi:hypothetical protein
VGGSAARSGPADRATAARQQRACASSRQPPPRPAPRAASSNAHPTPTPPTHPPPPHQQVGCLLPGNYRLVLSSDEEVFGGFRNLSKDIDGDHVANGGEHDRRPNSFLVYAPSR